jgi:hypothetical protein
VSDDLDDARARLAARREACFDRIDDAVSELIALHSGDADDILARVKATIAAEEQEAPNRR